ncbi:MAG: HAD family hydrolase [Actinomycetota bacterium]|nr:HAD family hydrolase [Actinomycetota bacterium]
MRAVLFDWGDTLMRFAYEPELVAAGHRAGLEAIGREGLPEVEAVTARYRERYEPFFWVPGTIDELEYPGLVRELLRDLGFEPTEDEVARFLEAEHAAWAPARQLGATSLALLEALRDRGLGVGLVSNAFDPPWLLHRTISELGLSERLDVAVFSSEIGKRKPHPAIFEHALSALGVGPADALFVGDRLYEDVRGASELGMRTVQALWFRADENPDGAEPDFRAFTPHDVLNVVRRLNGET